MSNKTELKPCELCELVTKLQVHHLIPQNCSRSNKYPKSLKTNKLNFIMICNECHRTLHALFSNQELRDLYSTKEDILRSEQFIKYLNWRKKHPNFRGSSKLSNNQKF